MFWLISVKHKILQRAISVLSSGGGVWLGGNGGSKADPDITGVKTLKNPIHNNIRKIWKTGLYYEVVLVKYSLIVRIGGQISCKLECIQSVLR